MTDQPADRRAAPRVAATFRIRLGYSDISSFVDGYAANISKGGIFVPTKQPRDKGAEVRFELLLKDGSTAVSGVGRVAWTKPFDAARPAERYGMGVEFTTLEGSSEEVVRQALAWRAKHLGDKAAREIADEGGGFPAGAKPKPEPKVAPKPEPKVTPQPEPKAAPQPEPKAAPGPEPTVAPGPEPTVAPEPEPKVAPKPPGKAAAPAPPKRPAFPARPLATAAPRPSPRPPAAPKPPAPPQPEPTPQPRASEPQPQPESPAPEPEAHLPSLEDLEAALAAAAVPAPEEGEAATPNGFDISVDEAAPLTVEPAGALPDAGPETPPEDAPGVQLPGGSAGVPQTFEDALRAALAEETAPDDAYEGVWMPAAAVASDSQEQILDRLMQQGEPAESSVPDMRFAAEDPVPAASAPPVEEKKGGLLGRLFGRKKQQ